MDTRWSKHNEAVFGCITSSGITSSGTTGTSSSNNSSLG
jgi:hypothetical protein